MDLVVTRCGGSLPSLEPPLMNFKIAGFFLPTGDFIQNCIVGQPWAMFSAFGSPELDASIGPRTLGLP